MIHFYKEQVELAVKLVDIKSKYDDLLRLRVGNYRIVYTVDNGKLIVYVIDIDNRGDIYKRY